MVTFLFSFLSFMALFAILLHYAQIVEEDTKSSLFWVQHDKNSCG